METEQLQHSIDDTQQQLLHLLPRHGGGDAERGDDTVFSLKISMIVVIFFLTFSGSYIPWLISPIFRKPWLVIAVINLLTAGAAGVIIGGCFSHLFPDATEAWEEYFEEAGPRGLANDDDVDYPFAPLIAIATLFALLFVDKCLISRGLGHSHSGGGDGQGHSHMTVFIPKSAEKKHKKKKKKGDKHDHDHVCEADEEEQEHCHKDIEMGEIAACDGHTKTKATSDGDECDSHCHSESDCSDDCHDDVCHSDSCSEDVCHDDKCDIEDECCSNKMESGLVTVPSAVVDCEGPKQDDESKKELIDEEEAEKKKLKEEEEKAEGDKDLIKRGSRSQIGRAWVFFIALSVHSIFDGLGVGVEESGSRFYALLAAVLAHKFLDGLVLGIAIYFAKFRWYFSLIGFIFCAAMTPIGIGVSLGVVSALEGSDALACKAFFLSMTAGSFLFISLIELLPASLEDGKLTFWKLFCAFIGWGIMALIALWV